MGPLIKHWVIHPNPNPDCNLFLTDVSTNFKIQTAFRIKALAGSFVFCKVVAFQLYSLSPEQDYRQYWFWGSKMQIQ